MVCLLEKSEQRLIDLAALPEEQLVGLHAGLGASVHKALEAGRR
jgi:hypothetical protein